MPSQSTRIPSDRRASKSKHVPHQSVKPYRTPMKRSPTSTVSEIGTIRVFLSELQAMRGRTRPSDIHTYATNFRGHGADKTDVFRCTETPIPVITVSTLPTSRPVARAGRACDAQGQICAGRGGFTQCIQPRLRGGSVLCLNPAEGVSDQLLPSRRCVCTLWHKALRAQLAQGK